MTWRVPELVVFTNPAVPVKVGEALKTKFPVPVVPVTEERRSAARMVETRFFEASVATKREGVRFESVVTPEIVRVPVKLAEDEMVCPLIKPEVITPRFELVLYKFVEVAVVEKRFVNVPLVEKKLVVVA